MKKQLFLLSLATLLLASCGGKGGEDSGVDPTSVKISTVLPERIFAGDSIQFEATLEPANANKELTWSVSNKSIMSIDGSTGAAKALAAGMVTVKVATKNNLKDSLSVIVEQYVPVESVNVGKASDSITADGGFAYMDAEVTPVDASDKGIEYSTSNASVATVDENGMVTAKAEGSCVITATSLDNPNAKASTTFYVEAGSWDNYRIVNLNDKVNIQDVQVSGGLDAVPVGKVSDIELLVVPYEFTDYPFDAKTVSDIDVLFNGKGKEDTGYWESVSSYYNKTSYGKTNIHVTVSDVYKSGVKAADQHGNNYSVNAAVNVFNWYKQQKGIDGTIFDNDHNGMVDAVYMVYSAPDYSHVSSLDNDLFWAYCHWTGNKGTAAKPAVNTYMWASYDFMYESGNSKVDAHTFIHETGHLLGANDYYNYNSGSSQKALGGIDMMDHNIGSHNVWTKMAYGFINPIYVEGDTKVTIKSAQDSATNNTIVLKPNWNETAFDEMIVLELSTPTGLNELDASVPYSSRPLVYDQPGIKMYHVDDRLVSVKSGRMTYLTKDQVTRSYLASNSCMVPAANTDAAGRNNTPELFYELGLIQSGKIPTMLKNGADGRNEDLFHTGDYFRFEDYSQFFIDKYHPEGKSTFNDGTVFNYQIYFESVTADEATLVIQKA